MSLSINEFIDFDLKIFETSLDKTSMDPSFKLRWLFTINQIKSTWVNRTRKKTRRKPQSVSSKVILVTITIIATGHWWCINQNNRKWSIDRWLWIVHVIYLYAICIDKTTTRSIHIQSYLTSFFQPINYRLRIAINWFIWKHEKFFCPSNKSIVFAHFVLDGEKKSNETMVE